MKNRFTLQLTVDQPNMIGRQWWHEGLRAPDPNRRALVIAGLVGAGFLGMCSLPSLTGPREERRRALDLQRTHGWSFGVAEEGAYFRAPTPASPAVLDSLVSALQPTQAAHMPFYVPTLFESVTIANNTPSAAPTEDRATQFTSLRDVVAPVLQVGMNDAREAGANAARRFAALPQRPALIIDLPGQLAVSFAAGAATAFDPIFTFDNWPHPRGAVPAGQTLSAALYELEHFRAAAPLRPGTAPPLFVLDRARLPKEFDENAQFDNRYLAKLPSAQALKELGVQQVLYATDLLPEADDVNDELVAYKAAGLPVTGYYLNTNSLAEMYDWKLASRSTPYSAAAPAYFGTVPVLLAANGALMGSRLYRNGSWNRSTSTWGGG